MEFFERAHVAKSKDSKVNKDEENVKKQLKQLLYFYKNNDKKLIQDFVERDEYDDDSQSVSGFSDLVLTNSSNDGNDSEILKSLEDDSFVNDIDQNSSMANTSFDVKDTTDSISEQNETESLGDLKERKDLILSNDESDSSMNDVLESNPDSNNSDVFDASGELAEEIHKRLQVLMIKKSRNKRISSDSESDYAVKISKNKRKHVENKTSESSEDLSYFNEMTENTEEMELSNLSPLSPPFVSITATDMPKQNFDEIIGEYKHSTIKNLSLNNQTTVSTDNSGFFVEETMSDSVGVDINTEEDVNSLIPELDDLPKVEEIDEEFKNLDTTLETVNEIDSTLVSECESDVPIVNIDVEQTYKIYNTHKGCIVVLKHPSELYIHGKVKLKGLGGSIEISGYILKEDVCDVYAPYHSYAQCVQTVQNPNAYYGLFGKLTATGLSVTKAEEIVTSINDQDGVIYLQSLENKAIDFVEKNFKTKTLFNKTNKVVEPYFRGASDRLQCSLYSIRPLKTLHVHQSWKDAFVQAESKHSRGIVCGGKGLGKSTYLRYQVNKLLNTGPVLVIDLDPGQCEFTVAGSISATVITSPLLGPNFTHLRKPDIMLNIGMINTMDNAKLYTTAVRNLLTQCHETHAFTYMPWIINTMGMTAALGLKFIALIIILTKPTYLLQYESKNPKKSFQSLLTATNVRVLYDNFKRDHLFRDIPYPADLGYNFVVTHQIEDSTNSGASMHARDERYLNFLAYFGELMNDHSNMLEIVPYEVSLKDLYVGTNVQVKPESLLKVINGKIVALCEREAPGDNTRLFTLHDKPLLCHGHGLVRGVDREKEVVYVITPIDVSHLRRVNTVVYAAWAPDLPREEGVLPAGTELPYRTSVHTHTRHLMLTPRRRFNPMQLIRMTRTA